MGLQAHQRDTIGHTGCHRDVALMSLEPVLILRCGGPWCGGRAGGALVLFRPGVCPWRVRGETASSAACAPRYNDRYATLKPREWTQVLARSTCLLVIGVSPDVDWPHVHSTQSLVKVPLSLSIYLSRWLRRPSGVLPRRVGSQLPAGAWFITEVRSLQDLRQQEDR